VVLVVVMGLAWILGTARSAGPDEPGHQVRGGALVRGQLDGEPFPDFCFQRAFELPGHVGFPDPVCFAFEEFVPASCTNDLEPVDGTTQRGTKAADYPVWGHLPAGVGTLAPAGWSAYTARLTDAVIPLGLFVAALWVAARRGALGVGSTLLGLTPMAWFMVGVVNPSGIVIAGGVGLWVALSAPIRVSPDRLVGWLAALSWAAMVLPRRDGMIWASTIVALVVLVDGVDVRAQLARIGRGGLAVVAASTIATLVWASTSDTNAALALFAVPLAPVAAWFARRGWERIGERHRSWRWLYALGLAALAVLGGLFVMTRRRAGFDRRALELTVGGTGRDLTEAIGNLGWLDTPIPTTALYAWVIGLGVLVGASIGAARWGVVRLAALVIGVGVFASWVLTMIQNDALGEYWQGRYYLPLLVGVPIVLGAARLAPDVGRRVGMTVAVLGLAVTNAALFAMLRRFAVGRSGSLFPWDWDTYEAPLPPVVLLAVHLIASLGLLWWVAFYDQHRAESDPRLDG
jgi:hypothetical protein